MSPKRKAAKNAADSIVMPKVSASDLNAAKEELKDKEMKRRANSNMHYWLETKGKKTLTNLYRLQTRKIFLWAGTSKMERLAKWLRKG